MREHFVFCDVELLSRLLQNLLLTGNFKGLILVVSIWCWIDPSVCDRKKQLKEVIPLTYILVLASS